MKCPVQCGTVQDSRPETVRLDAVLGAFLVERAGYIDRAAEISCALGLPARMDDRIEQVVANVRAEAEALWRQVIDGSIAREDEILGHAE